MPRIKSKQRSSKNCERIHRHKQITSIPEQKRITIYGLFWKDVCEFDNRCRLIGVIGRGCGGLEGVLEFSLHAECFGGYKLVRHIGFLGMV